MQYFGGLGGCLVISSVRKAVPFYSGLHRVYIPVRLNKLLCCLNRK